MPAGPPPLSGIHHVKLPVTDLPRSRDWYVRVLGLAVDREFRDEEGGPVKGVGGTVPGLDGTGFALREAPEPARGVSGFDPLALGVADRAAIDGWVAHLDALGIEHSPVIHATIGWLVALHDPDGIELRLYSRSLD
jgi:catechol 2,3-dioxygenase-like lactoylglutathione lyase family enzyme